MQMKRIVLLPSGPVLPSCPLRRRLPTKSSSTAPPPCCPFVEGVRSLHGGQSQRTRSRFPAAVPATASRPCSTGWPTSPCLPATSRAVKRNWPPRRASIRPSAVAVDALVPIVNPKNPINELSLDQLRTSTPARSPIGRNWAAPTPTSWSCPRHVLRTYETWGRNGHEEGQGHAQGPASGFQRRG